MNLQSVARTHVGCRRKINEDALLARADLRLWAVADGMGGHDAGEVASALVIDTLAALPPGLGLAARGDAVAKAIQDANARLIAMGRDGPQQRTIGSTVVALIAEGGGFACLWAGDSRAYLARASALSQLTHDHSLVQELVDAGELAPADANAHPNANVITRAVGANGTLQIDRIEGDIRPGDVFLIASDGLTRLASEAELLTSLQMPDLAAAADGLIETCLARGAPDNVTLIIVRAG
jgi:serine/threonine-protein phosphatase Stp1